MRTNSSLALPAELARHTYLRGRLLAQIPDLDAETLADSLEGMTDLPQMLGEVLRSALDDEALVEGLALRLSDLKARMERLSNRARRTRALALDAMTEARILRLVEPDFSASLRQGAVTLEVTAEEKIPSDYWKPQPPKLDRQGILAALKGGVEIDGVGLAAPQMQLSVRTR